MSVGDRDASLSLRTSSATPAEGRRVWRTIVKVVVAVVLGIALTSVVFVLTHRAWVSTHEYFAINSMQRMAKACQFYFLVNNGYPRDLRYLAPPMADPPYLGAEHVGDGTTVRKRGYRFTYAQPNLRQGHRGAFRIFGNPVRHGLTGRRHFYVDSEASGPGQPPPGRR